jgi:tRNA-2-methylthio-N6-dimethylallyladenosine synthase
MNFSDSRKAAEGLDRCGFRAVDRPQDADLILLNTCVVRQSAEDKVVGRLTSLQGLKRRRPQVCLVVMGCFIHEIPVLQDQYPWVDAFIRPSDVDAVIELAQNHASGTPHSEPRARAHSSAVPVSVGVPISFGCDHLCTYCIVRLRRGSETSRPLQEIVTEVEDLVRRGVKEITLLGQNVDSYGHDLAGVDPEAMRSGWHPDLADLLEAIHGLDGLERIRFLTSHPADMSERLIQVAARLPKVCEHMEVPLQSGADAILRRMGRGYTADQYRDLVARIRRAMPHVGLATDVIVGFPGETEAQFEATYRLLQALRFDMVHVAAYSPRPGTPAERLPDDVRPEEKERRRKSIDALQALVVGEINAQYLGTQVEVLVEGRHRGKWRGRMRNNKLVFFDTGPEDWTGQLAQVRITWTGPWSMQGEVIGKEI